MPIRQYARNPAADGIFRRDTPRIASVFVYLKRAKFNVIYTASRCGFMVPRAFMKSRINTPSRWRACRSDNTSGEFFSRLSAAAAFPVHQGQIPCSVPVSSLIQFAYFPVMILREKAPYPIDIMRIYNFPLHLYPFFIDECKC